MDWKKIARRAAEIVGRAALVLVAAPLILAAVALLVVALAASAALMCVAAACGALALAGTYVWGGQDAATSLWAKSADKPREATQVHDDRVVPFRR